MAPHIQACDVLVTEDAPSAYFQQMLTGDMRIDDYLLATDIEYPDFGQKMCRLWRRSHSAGLPVVQIEPFIEKLIEIHDKFADGGSPADIEPGTLHHRVYLAERSATGALLDFYQVSTSGTFDAVVAATKHFARLDARRFVLRDQLRAEAIRPLLDTYSHICVEAGQMHMALARLLRQTLPAEVKLKPVFLMRPIVSRLGPKRHLFGPGDLLTLLYVFHPNLDRERHTLLAAQALIYNKVIVKEEQVPDKTPYPHALDELQTIALVNRLSLNDCRILFDKIRRVPTARARMAVYRYLKQSDRIHRHTRRAPASKKGGQP